VTSKRTIWIARLGLALLLLGPLLSLAVPSLPESAPSFVLFQLRVPRLLAGLLVGGTLGLSGAATQAVFANPLSTPSTTGTLAGATLGALLAMVLFPSLSLGGFSLIVICSFVFALGASLVVALLALGPARRTQDLLLIGIAVTLATTALSTGLEDIADARALVAAARWSLGSLAQVGYDRVLLAGALLLPLWIGILLQVRALQSLVLGDELAHTRGVAVARVRFRVLTLVAAAIGLVVAWCGPIAFVGLVVPHLIRLAIGASQRIVLPGSLIAGAGLLVFCDALGKLVVPGRELSVGVITALVGAPALALLVWRRGRTR
jgi:iron complex transport system permease protein